MFEVPTPNFETDVFFLRDIWRLARALRAGGVGSGKYQRVVTLVTSARVCSSGYYYSKHASLAITRLTSRARRILARPFTQSGTGHLDTP